MSVYLESFQIISHWHTVKQTYIFGSASSDSISVIYGDDLLKWNCIQENDNMHSWPRYRVLVLTVSPPEANEMRGISCCATIRPDSSAVNTRPQLEIVRFTFAPACSMIGWSAIARWTRFSAFLFLSAVLSPAASHTLLMHSLWSNTNTTLRQ